MSPTFESGIYEGWVQHRRIHPKNHQFRYPIFMMYLDLDELPELFRQFRGFSDKPWSPIRFCREDYLGPKHQPLHIAVREAVQRATGSYPSGPIRMLTHPRYLSFCFNPVTFYYLFDEAGDQLAYILAEITNTPWNERFHYVMSVQSPQKTHRFAFEKDFHVSPFFPMDMDYQWNFSTPSERLKVHMRNLIAGQRQFDASLHLERHAFNQQNVQSMVLRYPLITIAVVWRIYYQALRLWLKKIPFYTHPNKREKLEEATRGSVNFGG